MAGTICALAKAISALASLTLLALWLALVPGAVRAQNLAPFSTPAAGEPMPIGGYSNGCLQGGVALPLDGTGYQVVRPSLGRYWGHPRLLDYITDLGERAAATGLNPVMIADMSRPRGGFLSGHVSHQIGLDVDLWLRQDTGRVPVGQRDGLSSTLVVDRAAFAVGWAWSDAHATLIRLAASDPRVSRIFIHPAIKIALCEQTTGDRDWLRVLRPWFGHDSHMHVRLHCALGDLHCQPQEPVPPGDGCDAELYSWIPDPANPPPPPAARPPPPPPHPLCVAMANGG